MHAHTEINPDPAAAIDPIHYGRLVRLPGYLDDWAAGDHTGVLVTSGRVFAYVRLLRSGRTVKIVAADLVSVAANAWEFGGAR